MVKFNSSSRFSPLKGEILLVQTDTTVGFLSQNKQRLDDVKKRESSKPYLINFFDFKTFKKYMRVPKIRKKEVRRAKKTTFVVKNQAFRVAKPKPSSAFLREIGWCYSTSANLSFHTFDREFAYSGADVIIENQDGLFEKKASAIYKINSKRKIRLR